MVESIKNHSWLYPGYILIGQILEYLTLIASILFSLKNSLDQPEDDESISKKRLMESDTETEIDSSSQNASQLSRSEQEYSSKNKNIKIQFDTFAEENNDSF